MGLLLLEVLEISLAQLGVLEMSLAQLEVLEISLALLDQPVQDLLDQQVQDLLVQPVQDPLDQLVQDQPVQDLLDQLDQPVQALLDQLVQDPQDQLLLVDPLLLLLLFLAPLVAPPLSLQQQLLEVQVVTTTHGPRKVKNATKSLMGRQTTLMPRLHAKLLEPMLTWQLQRLRKYRRSSTICGQLSKMRTQTPGLVWTIVVQQQFLAMTMLMELSLSQMDQLCPSLLALLIRKM